MTTSSIPAPVTTQSQIPQWVTDWFEQLPSQSLADTVTDPKSTAIFSADMIVGFCDSRQPRLAPDRRVDRAGRRPLHPRARTRAFGISSCLQDTHDPATPEFGAWPVHCVAGTDESETIPELAELPFAGPVYGHPEKRARHPATAPSSTYGSMRDPRSRPRSWSAIAPISAPTASRCTCGCGPTRSTSRASR